MKFRNLCKKYGAKIVAGSTLVLASASFAEGVIPAEAQTYLAAMMLLIAAVGTAGLVAIIAAGSYKLVRKAF